MKQTIILILSVILVACNCEKPESEKVENLYSYNVEEKIKELGIKLVEPGKPVANYVGAVKTGNLVFLSGKISRNPEGELIIGKLGTDLTVEQ
ncbi:MAG: RidA family protein, partial [Prolixibacteraceae bacterium]|nr:RidA family protein [Prolixibacteraceae bacterium]